MGQPHEPLNGLCITMKPGEITELRTGSGLVRVQLREIRSNQVRITFEAPRSVDIQRDAHWKAQQAKAEAIEEVEP